MSQNYFYPSSSASANPSVGPNGNPIPGDATLVGGENPSGNLQPLQTDPAGNLLVSIAADPISPLNVNLQDVGGAAVSLGQKTSAASLPVVIASDQSTLNVSDATTHSDLATINTTLGSPFQAGGAISNTSFAATQSTASALNATIVGTTAAGSGSASGLMTIQGNASGTPVPISGTVTITPSGEQNVNLNQVGGSAVSLGQKASASSIPVVIASDQSSVPVSATFSGSPGPANAPVYNIYSSTNITTAAYTQLIASTASATNRIDIFDSSGQAMILAIGAPGVEVIQLYVQPGGDTQSLAIPAGTRVAYKALTANATTGYLLLNLLQ